MAKDILIGRRQLERKLGRLAGVPSTPKMQVAFEAAAAAQRDAVAAEAPVADGKLRNSVKSGPLGSGQLGAYVTVLAPHAHLVNYGTVQRHHKSGKSVGIMPANPFFDRGTMRTRRKASDLIKRGAKEAVDSAVR